MKHILHNIPLSELHGHSSEYIIRNFVTNCGHLREEIVSDCECDPIIIYGGTVVTINHRSLKKQEQLTVKI